MNRTLLKRATLVLAAALALTAFATREDSWRIIGPGGGGALFHPTVSPHDPRTALVASDMTGNYITTDAGGRWRRVSRSRRASLAEWAPSFRVRGPRVGRSQVREGPCAPLSPSPC